MRDSTADELGAALRNLLELRGVGLADLSASIVSSTVPQLEPEWMSMAQRYLGHRMLAVGPGLRTGMAIRIDNPRELGADRLVNAVAAHALLGGPCISVDFGTAVNYDVVSAEGEYLGGVIAPGVEISLDALTSRGAKLPRIDLAAAALGDRQGHRRRDPLGHRLRLRRPGRRHHHADPRRSWARTRRRSRPAASPRTVVPSTTTIDEVDDLLTLTGPAPAVRAQRLTDASGYPCGVPQPALTEPFEIGGIRVPNRVLLAPLAGIGNWFVRLQARRYGAGMAVSEMVSSHAIHYGNEKTLTELLRIDPRERMVGDVRGPGLDPALRPGPRGDALGRGDGRRARGRPDRPEHGLPGAEGLQDRRGRGADQGSRHRRRRSRGRRARAAGCRSP